MNTNEDISLIPIMYFCDKNFASPSGKKKEIKKSNHVNFTSNFSVGVLAFYVYVCNLY